MRKLILFIIFIPVALSSLETYQEVALGYSEDLGVYMGLRLDNLSTDSPFFIQARGGYIYQKDPGNAEDARSIYINDGTGGSIEEYGESYLLALDLGYKLSQWNGQTIEVSISGLWNHYKAHFGFIGDNEVFAVKTSAFGLGLGGALRIPLSKTQNSLMIKTTVEYYPKTLIEAHGTFYYTPSGDDDNVRNDYTYEDADGAINQPEFRFSVLVGFLYKIGG